MLKETERRREREKRKMNAALYAARHAGRTAFGRNAMLGRRQRSNKSAVMNAWNAILSRNFSYITFIVLGAITLETIYGSATNGLWKVMNRGKLYQDIDWSKFEEEEEEEDEDDE